MQHDFVNLNKHPNNIISLIKLTKPYLSRVNFLKNILISSITLIYLKLYLLNKINIHLGFPYLFNL